MKRFLFATVVLSIVITSGCDKIICKYRNLPDLGNGYKFETYDCKTLSIINSSNTEMIPPEILYYSFDSTFVIAAQRSWDSIPHIRQMDYYEAEKAFETSTFVRYWILNKKEKNENIGVDTVRKRDEGTFEIRAIYSNVYGPYKWKEYLRKRKELGVPENLILEMKK